MYIFPHIESQPFDVMEATGDVDRLSAADLGVVLHFLEKAQALLESIKTDSQSVAEVTELAQSARDAVFFAFERMSHRYLTRRSRQKANLVMAEIFELAYYLAEDDLLEGEPMGDLPGEDLEGRCKAARPLVEIMLGIFRHSCEQSANREAMFTSLVWHWMTHNAICTLTSARFIAEDQAGGEPSCQTRLWLRSNELCEQFARELFRHPIMQIEAERDKAEKGLWENKDHRTKSN